MGNKILHPQLNCSESESDTKLIYFLLLSYVFSSNANEHVNTVIHSEDGNRRSFELCCLLN